ncbi:glycosyltransferase family 2 protein [Microlunatus parietis]|uniref:Glycosyltransferase involved in cell wall biosynthesis n=1 Tax=Microlunatus parietis TaxID=682979 RepID=A0A7Y9LF16_9ACTN|nr:glycosyltransferase family 2 protein [Microlunatus parietis]NYE75602.1 glycosyltransferase involved in cell wall biosynthesis [Microlunatus parietis]
MPKVSVVIATYNSGSRVEETVRSLLGQTLPAEEYEGIFVDDGSTDGTYALVERLIKDQPQLRLHQIPNSGWSGRPRNLGTDRATGEYVLYLDHDDQLFPDALRRMYDYAVETGADVVLGKEVMKGDPLTPGWPTWQGNVADAGVDQRVLHCVTPHKLYRRSLLAETKIRFPEGPVRLEDQYFNAAVYAATDKIAILADYPCYQWLIHDQNLHRAGFDFDVFLDSFERSLEPIEALPDGPKRRALLKRWYVRVILRWLGPGDHPIRDRFLSEADRLLRHFPVGMDADLEPIDRVRSWLYRRGDRAGLDALRERDRTVKLGLDPVREVAWDRGVLRVMIKGRLQAGDEPYPVAEGTDGPIIDLAGAGLPDLPPESATRLGDLAATVVDLGLRGRNSGVEWPMPGGTPLRLDAERRLTFTVAARIELGPGGSPLRGWLDGGEGDEIFDARLHLTGLGYERIDPVRADPLRQAQDGASTGSGHGFEVPALIAGLPAVPYRTNDGRLAVDLTRLGEARRILPLTRIDPAASRVRPDRVRLGLTGLHTYGDTELTGTVGYESSAPAALVAEPDRPAELRFRPEPGDTFAVHARFQDRQTPLRAELDLAAEPPVVRPLPEPAAAKSHAVPGAKPTGTLRTDDVRVTWAGRTFVVTVTGTASEPLDSASISVRGRASGIEVPVHRQAQDPDSRFEVTGRVDVAGLEDDIWDVRLDGHGASGKHRDPVRIGSLTELPALVDGRAAVAYATQDGGLALDLTETARTVVGAARPGAEDVTTDAGEVVVALARVQIAGSGRLSGRAVTESQRPARLVATDAGAELVVDGPVRADRRDLMFAFTGHRSSRRMTVDFGADTATVAIGGETAATVPLALPAPDPEPGPEGVGGRFRRGLRKVWNRRRGVDDSS